MQFYAFFDFFLEYFYPFPFFLHFSTHFPYICIFFHSSVLFIFYFLLFLGRFLFYLFRITHCSLSCFVSVHQPLLKGFPERELFFPQLMRESWPVMEAVLLGFWGTQTHDKRKPMTGGAHCPDLCHSQQGLGRAWRKGLHSTTHFALPVLRCAQTRQSLLFNIYYCYY